MINDKLIDDDFLISPETPLALESYGFFMSDAASCYLRAMLEYEPEKLPAGLTMFNHSKSFAGPIRRSEKWHYELTVNYAGPGFSQEIKDEVTEFVRLAVGTPWKYQSLITGHDPNRNYAQEAYEIIKKDIREAKLEMIPA